MSAAMAVRGGSHDDRVWEAALAELTGEGVLAAEAAGVVRARHDLIEESQRQHSRRTALIELAGYLGAALMIGGVVAISSQVWGGFSELVQVLLVGALAVAALAAAWLLAASAPGGASALIEVAQAARRRLVAVLGIAGAGLATATVVLALQEGLSQRSADDWFWTAPVVGLMIAAVVSRFAPGVIPTLGVGGFLVGSVLSVLGSLGWYEAEWAAPVAIMALAAFASLVLVRFLRPAVLIEAVSVIAWLGAAIPMLSADPGLPDALDDAAGMLWSGRIGLVLLIALGAWRFARGGEWPWAIGVAVGSAALIGMTFAEALGGAVAMTVAGAVLIVVALLMMRSRRVAEHRREPGPA